MRHDTHSATPAPETVTVQDLRLPNGCILCGGDLAVRFTGATAASYCPRCNWLSHPPVRREDGNVFMTQPAGGVA